MKTLSYSLIVLLAGPSMVPAKPKSDYKRPQTLVSSEYKAPSVWREMRPLETLSRGAWWTVFKDPTLNRLEARATAENQQLRAAITRFDQARATARVARGNFFPQATLNPQLYTPAHLGERTLARTA